MRILFATNRSYLPQRTGGSETVTHDMCVELARLGHVAAVISALEPHGPIGLRNRVARKVLRRGNFPPDNTMGYPVFRGWKPVEGAAEVVESFSPDVAVVQAGDPVPLADSLVALGVPTVFYIHDTQFDEMGGAIRPRAGLFFVANSEFTARVVRETLGVVPAVIPPLVRPDAYPTETTGEYVLFVNPHARKGVEVAFQLAERRPDIPFVFLESWQGYKELEEYRDRADRASNITWRRRVSDMGEVYARTRILLAPSQWDEPWGRVVTEAQFAGIPALASRSGGLPESVGPGGLLVERNAELEEWEQALSELWDDVETYRRLSAAAREYSRRPSNQPSALIGRFLDLIDAHIQREETVQPAD